MRSAVAFAAALPLLAAGCRKDAPPPPDVVVAKPRGPRAVKLAGFLHAVQCDAFTARWTGSAKDGPTPLAAEALSFLLPDGRALPYTPKGELFPADQTFEVFSPDCAWVLLPSDHYGPYHLVDLLMLPAYLEGKAAPTLLGLLRADGAEARVHASPRWVSRTEVQFEAACCGGVEVLKASVANPRAPERVFFAPSAPHGVREVDGGFEVVP